MPQKTQNDITIVTRVDRITKDAILAYAERRHIHFATAVRDILQRALKTTPNDEKK